MAAQFFELDDPWTGPVIDVFEDSVYLTSTDNWITGYHGKLYIDVTKSANIAIALRVYFLDSEEGEISMQSFAIAYPGETTIEVQFPAEEHIIAMIRFDNFSEGAMHFYINDIRSDNIVPPDIFWTGLKGLTEIA